MPTNCSAAKQLPQFYKHSKSADLLRKSLLSHVWRVPSSKALSCKHERLFDLLTLASSYNETFYLWVSSKTGGWLYILRKTSINHACATYHTTHPSCCHATTDVQCLPVDVSPIFFELEGPQGGGWGGGRPRSRPPRICFRPAFQSSPNKSSPWCMGYFWYLNIVWFR